MTRPRLCYVCSKPAIFADCIMRPRSIIRLDGTVERTEEGAIRFMCGEHPGVNAWDLP